jgi:hypothetical protein
MSAAVVSKDQIRAIHTLKSKAGLDETSYRDMLRVVGGVASSKELSLSGAIAVIDRLRALSSEPQAAVEPSSKPKGALDLSGPYAGICRALWISAWNLGVVDAREDTALVAFVRRQTGIDHLNWVRDAADGNKVVEALKAWIAREAGVTWPHGKAWSDAQARKLAVVKAQLARLGNPDVPVLLDHLDNMMKALGRKIRALPKVSR